jgi:D-alanyl-D-alanine endopeptidase (penicillin-binding protein 7)
MIAQALINLLLLPIMADITFVGQLSIGGLGLANFDKIVADQRIQLPSKKSDLLDVVISADSAIAVDAQTGQILYGKNFDNTHSIASITKLMTALVFLRDNPDLNQGIRFTEGDRHVGNVQNFHIGEVISKRNLLATTLIASDNEAAYVLARSSGKNVSQFVAEMNVMAKELGMLGTEFFDPTGLDSRNTSSASDLVKLLSAAFRQPLIAEFTTTPRYRFSVEGINEKPREMTIYNTDKLLDTKYLDVIGGKTGYIREAGYCLATKVKNGDGREVYIVVLKSNSLDERFQDVKAIDYYVTKNF